MARATGGGEGSNHRLPFSSGGGSASLSVNAGSRRIGGCDGCSDLINVDLRRQLRRVCLLRWRLRRWCPLRLRWLLRLRCLLRLWGLLRLGCLLRLRLSVGWRLVPIQCWRLLRL